MMTKNLLVFFLAIASLLLIATTASAATDDLADIESVEINDLEYQGDGDISVEAGEVVEIKVYFTALENASDVRIEAEVEGDKVDVSDKISGITVEEGKRYSKTLRVKLPYELKDEVSDDLELNLRIWNDDYSTDYEEITLRVQRPSYNIAVMSIESRQTIEAGEQLLVNIVLKNTGYNYLDDVYVTATIPELGMNNKIYLGDVVAVECDCDEDDDDCDCDEDDEDTIQGKFYLQVPYDAEPGIYNLGVKASNDDITVEAAKQIMIKNEFAAGNVIANTLRKSFAVGEEAQYTLVVANPTDKLKVYRIVVDSSDDLSTSVDNAVVAVPAGSSKTVIVSAEAAEAGEYMFKVNVFSGEELSDTLELKAEVEGKAASNSSVIALTVILVVIFLVLLAILIVLLGKKPEKTEDFGESYY